MSKKVLLIGAGPTSSLLAYILKGSEALLKVPLEIHIWEKSRGAGGRFSTSRSPNNKNCIADLGAQYLTRKLSNTVSKPYFDELTSNGLIQNFSTTDIPGFLHRPENENYVCVQGTGSIVKHFLSQAKVSNTIFNKRVVSIKAQGDGRVEVIPEGEQSEQFDIVISTMPVPQILQLENVDLLLAKSSVPNLREKLSEVTYTSRYALGIFCNEVLSIASQEGAINFVDQDNVIRYWTVENQKRRLGSSSSQGEGDDASTAIVVHTSVQFGAENVEKSLDEMKQVLLKNIQGKIKTLEGKTPDFVKCHKWRYSQVGKGFTGSPGFVVLSESPLILAAGDGFIESGFENCVLSAEKSAQYLIKALA